MKKAPYIAAVLAVFFFFAGALEAGEYGVGFQSSWPAWGLSGMYDVNEEVSAQAVLGFAGTANAYSIRGLYRFHREESWNAYGYGSLGLWTYRHRVLGSESALGFGGGAGIEYDWRAINPELPPIYWNLEIGIASVGLDHYSVSALMLGLGAHYRF